MTEGFFLEKRQGIVGIKNVSLGRIYWYLFLCGFILFILFLVQNRFKLMRLHVVKRGRRERK